MAAGREGADRGPQAARVRRFCSRSGNQRAHAIGKSGRGTTRLRQLQALPPCGPKLCRSGRIVCAAVTSAVPLNNSSTVRGAGGGAACRGQTGLSGVHDGPVAAMTQMLGVSCQRCRVLVVGILLAARPASRGSAAFIAPRSHGRMPRPSRCAGASAPVSHDDGRGEADARPKSSSRRCIGSDGSRQTRPRAATAGRDTKVAGRANAGAAGARALGVAPER
jgi:hypothetical protein